MAQRGRRAWRNPKALEADIEAYFQDCEEKGRPLTMQGLALWLGVERATVSYYTTGKRGPEFRTVFARALDRVRVWTVEQLYNPATHKGAAFVLERNFGYGGRGAEPPLLEDDAIDAAPAVPQIAVIPPDPSRDRLATVRWEPDAEGDSDQ